MLLAACTADHAAAPGLFVLDDVGTGRWRTVSTGASHSCALDDQGRAWCWGSNERFQLGVFETASRCGTPEVACSLEPMAVASGRAFRMISAGGSHTCAIATDSVPYCWGNNADGQLGVIGPTGAALRIPGSVAMIAISAGASHSCGIRVDRVLVCWGSNLLGAVGAGAGVPVSPVVVAGSQRFSSVQASDERTCARTVDGRLWCWGVLWDSSAGDRNYAAVRATPRPVANLGAMSAIGLGPSSTCTTDRTGFAWCWETNIHGEGGIGPGPGSVLPRRVATDESFAGVTVGATHACALTVGGTAWCWGSNRNGQLGAASTEFCGSSRTPCNTRPAPVSGRQHFMTLAAGLGSHVCGVTDQYNLYCWGAGSFGQRGDGVRTASSRVPRLAVDVHAK